MIDRQRLAAFRRTAQSTHQAFLAVPFLLVILGWLMKDDSTVWSGPVPLVALAVLMILGLFSLGVVLLLRQRWSDRVSAVRHVADPTTALAAVLNTRRLVELSLWEAIVIIGFVMVMMGAPFYVLVGAAIATVAGELSSYPRSSDWEAAADEVEQLVIAGANT